MREYGAARRSRPPQRHARRAGPCLSASLRVAASAAYRGSSGRWKRHVQIRTPTQCAEAQRLPNPSVQFQLSVHLPSSLPHFTPEPRARHRADAAFSLRMVARTLPCGHRGGAPDAAHTMYTMYTKVLYTCSLQRAGFLYFRFPGYGYIRRARRRKM